MAGSCFAYPRHLPKQYCIYTNLPEAMEDLIAGCWPVLLCFFCWPKVITKNKIAMPISKIFLRNFLLLVSYFINKSLCVIRYIQGSVGTLRQTAWTVFCTTGGSSFRRT